MPWLLKLTGVAEGGPVKRRMRQKAAKALVRYTQSAIEDLKADEDEMLRGVDWGMVAQYVDISSFLPLEDEDEGGGGSDKGSDGGGSDAASPRSGGGPNLGGGDGGGHVEGSGVSWTERTGLAQAAAWSTERMNRMMGRQRSGRIPRWSIDPEGSSLSFTTPLLRSESEAGSLDGGDGALREVIAHSSRQVDSEGRAGPDGCGTAVMQPWPNNLADLERAHGRFAQDLPFTGMNLASEGAGGDGGDATAGGDGSGSDAATGSVEYSQELPAAAEQAGGQVAEAADVLPITTPPPRDGSQAAPAPTASGLLFSSAQAERQVGSSTHGSESDSGRNGEQKAERQPLRGDQAAMDAALNPQTASWEQHPKRADSEALRSEPSESGSSGRYLVMPQPILVPRLANPDSPSEKLLGSRGESATAVSWLPVDLRRLQHTDQGARAGPPDDWAAPPTPSGFSSSAGSGPTGGALGLAGASGGSGSASLSRSIRHGSAEGRASSRQSPDTGGWLAGSARGEGHSSSGNGGGQRPTLGTMPAASGMADPASHRASPGSPGAGGSAMHRGFHEFNTHEPGLDAEQTSASAQRRYEQLSPGDAEAMTVEARLRLLAGLKRYFHNKRAEGLLSGEGVRILDFACDYAMDKADQPLAIWSFIQAEVAGAKRTKTLAWSLWQTMVLRKWLRTTRIPLLHRIFTYPRALVSRWLNWQLSAVMLVGLEAAVEFWLALSWSPQAQWLRYSDPSGCLLEEVRRESKEVWRFIIEREIEAPDRFQAIQSYRAAMAILRQQERFIEQLYGSGMVDDAEKEELQEPVEARTRALSRLGAVWRPPLLLDILRSLPFMLNVPEPLFERMLAAGQLIMYTAGDVIWRPLPVHKKEAKGRKGRAEAEEAEKAAASQGIFVVLQGIVRSAYAAPDDNISEFFLGRGGMFGLLPALTGESLPGARPVIAEGNLLRRGPVVFRVPPEALAELQAAADRGEATCEQLILDLWRVAALYVSERMRNEVVATVAAHYQQLALAAARRAAARALCRSRSARHQAAKDPKVKAKEKAAAKKPTLERARTFLEAEFEEAPPAKKEKKEKKEKDQALPAEGEERVHGGRGQHSAFSAAAGAAWPPGEAAGAGGRRPGGSPAEGGPGAGPGVPSNEELLAGLDPQELWQDVQQHASVVLAALKEGLREAEVLELRPGGRLAQRSSLVVLKGTLRAAGHASDLPTTQGSEADQDGAGYSVLVQYHAPCIMPWLWDEAAPAADPNMRPSHITLRAGRHGATVVVCPPEHDSDTEATDAETDTEESSFTTARGAESAELPRSGASGEARAGAAGGGEAGFESAESAFLSATSRTLESAAPGAEAPAASPPGGSAKAPADDAGPSDKRRSSGGRHVGWGDGGGSGAEGEGGGRQLLRRRKSMQRLPPLASSTGNETADLSSFASGTGKSSAERLKVIQVEKEGREREKARKKGRGGTTPPMPEDVAGEAEAEQQR